MPVAIVLITVGALLVYSSIEGITIADAFAGMIGRKLNPAGTSLSDALAPLGTPTPATPGDTKGDVGTGQFKGPNAALLKSLADVATGQYHLTITQICRPQNATYGAPNSLHKQCRAFDASGSVANKVAFARYAKGVPGVAEVFCDQAGMVAPGYEHSSHVHVGA